MIHTCKIFSKDFQQKRCAGSFKKKRSTKFQEIFEGVILKIIIENPSKIWRKSSKIYNPY